MSQSSPDPFTDTPEDLPVPSTSRNLRPRSRATSLARSTSKSLAGSRTSSNSRPSSLSGSRPSSRRMSLTRMEPDPQVGMGMEPSLTSEFALHGAEAPIRFDGPYMREPPSNSTIGLSGGRTKKKELFAEDSPSGAVSGMGYHMQDWAALSGPSWPGPQIPFYDGQHGHMHHDHPGETSSGYIMPSWLPSSSKRKWEDSSDLDDDPSGQHSRDTASDDEIDQLLADNGSDSLTTSAPSSQASKGKGKQRAIPEEDSIITIPDSPVAPKSEKSLASLSKVVPSKPPPEPLSAYTCPICFSPPTNATLTPCGHICCGVCLFTAVKTTIHRSTLAGVPDASEARCPVCRATIPGWDGKGGGVIGLKARAIFSL